MKPLQRYRFCACSLVISVGMHMMHRSSGESFVTKAWSHSVAWIGDALADQRTDDLALLGVRQLRSVGGARIGGHTGGSSGQSGAGQVQPGDLLLYISLAIIGAAFFCCTLRAWVAYRNAGGDMELAMQDMCMMVSFFTCGLGGSHRCWCVWLFHRCWRRGRYQTMPMPSIRAAEVLEQTDVWRRSAVGQAQTFEDASGDRFTQPDFPISGVPNQVVVRQEYLAAQARTAVSAYEPPLGDDDSNSTLTECIICLEPFAEGSQLRTLPCMHRYHMSCIDKWLSVHLSCPLCKNQLSKRSITC